MNTVNSNNTSISKKEQDDEVLDVLVIGAGWSGLSCANELLQKNPDLTIKILEGRHDLGGRCRPLPLEDGVSVVELGAQWIHGAKKNNPVYTTALASGVEMARSEYSSQIVYQDTPEGMKEVSDDKIEEMEQRLYEGKKGWFKYQEKRQDNDDYDCSLEQCMEDYLQKINATQEERTWLHYILESSVSQEYSGSLSDMSMYWWDSDGEIKGGDVHLAKGSQGGYSYLMKYFTRDLIARKLIDYNAIVKSIDYSVKGRVVVRYTQNGADLMLQAKRAVVTVPIGVLQAKSIQFTPELPQAKQRAIDRMGNGVLNKCIFVWDDSQTDQLPWPQDKEWMERIVMPGDTEHNKQGLWTEFFNSRPVTGRPMLCAFTAGRIAQQLEQLTDEEVGKSALQTLQRMFPAQEIPEPKRVIVTKWGQDEFARGSYSFNALGGKHSDRKQLAAPVDSTLYFAGEACHSQYFGTTHGAYLSGTATAKQILSSTNSMSKRIISSVFPAKTTNKLSTASEKPATSNAQTAMVAAS